MAGARLCDRGMGSPTVLFPPRGGEGVGLIHVLSMQANSQKKCYSPCFSIRSLLYLSKGFFSFQWWVSPCFCSVTPVLIWGREVFIHGLIWRCCFLSLPSSLRKGSKQGCSSLRCCRGEALPALHGSVRACSFLPRTVTLYRGQEERWEMSRGKTSLRMLPSHSRISAAMCRPLSYTNKNSD